MAAFGCILSIADTHLSKTVRALLTLEGIFCADTHTADAAEKILITDVFPVSAQSCRGIVFLTRQRIPPESVTPLCTVLLPLSYAELLSAVRSLEDETAFAVPQAPLSANAPAEGIVFSGGSITYRGKSASLTDREAKLFDYLYSRRGEIVSRTELLHAVWENETCATNITDVYISYLRQKLVPVFGQGVLLSVRGKGYVLALPE